MSEHLHCHLCGEPATVHLTQIINSKVHKLDLCDSCAQEKGVTDAEGFSLAEFLSNSLVNPLQNEDLGLNETELICSECGLTVEMFKKYGRLGCAQCYEDLWPVIEPVLDGMHKGIQHQGKQPESTHIHVDYKKRIIELDEMLTLAVKEERYEDAAQYRDEIQKIKEFYN